MNPIEILNANNSIGQTFSSFWWIVLPVCFYFFFKFLWMDFVIKNHLNSLQWTLLEIIPPRDIERSPKVMESIFSGLAGVITSYNTLETYLKGLSTDRFSLEIVGDEGVVHFYIRTQKKYRNLVEAQIYAQYPGAEIVEMDDYVSRFPIVMPNKEWNIWGTDVELTMPDPYPIRTYDHFDEDITGTMIDPMSAIAEVMGRLGPGQHLWFQIVIDPQHELWRDDELALVDKLAKKAEKKVKGVHQHFGDVLANLLKALSGPVEFGVEEKKDEAPLEFKLTPGEKEVLKAVEENLGKNAFKTKMRFLYIGMQEVFDKSNVSSFFGAIKQFNDLNLNNFKPNDASKTYANYLMKKERMLYRQRKIYKRYRERNMDGVKFILTTKELATIFHFPDMNVKAPSLRQVQYKRGSAPPNLPINLF